MSKKFKQLIAIMLVASQVLTCNAFSVLAKDFKMLMSDDRLIELADNKKSVENENLSGAEDASPDFDLEDEEVDLDLQPENLDDNSYITTNNNNSKNNEDYEEEPEEDEVATDKTISEDADSQVDNANDTNADSSSDTNDEEQKINIVADVAEGESQSDNKDDAGVDKSSEVEKPTVDVNVEVIDDDVDGNTNTTNVGVDKESKVEQPKVDIVADTADEDEEFVFTDADFIGVDVNSEVETNENLEDVDVASGSEAEEDELLGKASKVSAENLTTFVVWGDVGYDPGDHADRGYLGVYDEKNKKFKTDTVKSSWNKNNAGPNLHSETNWYVSTRESNQSSNFKNRDFLNQKQNIKGFVINEYYDDRGFYDLKVVDGVKFNNEWDIHEAQSSTHWHIEEEPSGDNLIYDKNYYRYYWHYYYY